MNSPTVRGLPAKRQAFGDTVINTIAQHSPNFKDLILHAEIRTPWDIENEVGLTEGNIFQGELTMDQLLFNRPLPGYAQYRAPVKGMYMCGSSTHPGGGVMGAAGRERRPRCLARSAAAACEYDCIIVGAGHNGLVCASLLARAGRSVLILEASDQIGRRCLDTGIRSRDFAYLHWLIYCI